MSRQFMKQSAEPGVLMERNRGIFFDWGLVADLPIDGVKGYARGCLWIASDSAAGSNIYVNNGSFASCDFVLLGQSGGGFNGTIPANTANALTIGDGTTSFLKFNTQTATDNVKANMFGAAAPTITAAAGTTYSQVATSAETVTLTGTTGVTALNGLALNLGAVTVTDASAVTVTTMSSLYVALPVAGGSVTATTTYTATFAGAIRVDGNISLANAAYDVLIPASTAAALEISDGTTKIMALDTRSTVTSMAAVTVIPSPPTIASAASVMLNSAVSVPARTLTFTGTNVVTSVLGVQMNLASPTFTDASAGTITTVSTLHVAAPAAAGGALTITNTRMISTSVSDCFLTGAGVWTDTASARFGKDGIKDPTEDDVGMIIDQIKPRSWKYRPEVHGDDGNCCRVGIVSDELPEALQTPGSHRMRKAGVSSGISAGVLASFSMAAVKHLHDENKSLRSTVTGLEERLAKMEKLLAGKK